MMPTVGSRFLGHMEREFGKTEIKDSSEHEEEMTI